jgi:hypothetical protein
LGGIIKILPKIGALRNLKVKAPDPVTEKLFIESFDTVQMNFTLVLKEMLHEKKRFQNIDYDTGIKTFAGEYALTDETYLELLLKLYSDHFISVNAGLKINILRFYDEDNQKLETHAGPEKWKQITQALDSIKELKPVE